MTKEKVISIVEPKPFAEVGLEFTISGSVPRSWLLTNLNTIDNRIFLDLIDINGLTFVGDTIFLGLPNWVCRIFGINTFVKKVRLDRFNNFLINSQGRLTLKIHGQDEKTQSIYLPIIIKELESREGPDPDIVQKHKNIEVMIKKYESDLKEYYKEWEQIREFYKNKLDENRYYDQFLIIDTDNQSLIQGILEAVSASQEDLNQLNYSIERKQKETELDEKYREAINWRGPLLRGVVGRMNGFQFTVYSDDHDSHFHVIHKGNNIDARFSFPQIELINYKNSKNIINSKTQKAIKLFFDDPKNFDKLKKEFEKRD